MVDGLPVLAEPAPLPPVAAPPGWRTAVAAVPKRQAVVAASSFLAGAAVLAVVNHKRAVRMAPRLTRGSLGEIVGTDHYLIDVHRIRRTS
ncbi:MAG: hypothetical protein QOF76_1673 [Solirubrobacteraceae bacterium]|nr:hypothetical protein [Solirubrobacteraceae bacterium]